MAPTVVNAPAPNVPFFVPAQDPPSGTALDPQPDGRPIPKLFQPLTIRGVTFQNRIWLSPLCQYSAEDGHVSPWHVAHIGGIISRGPGLSLIEATAIVPEGRITPEDLGIWSDDHIVGLKSLTDFAHSQGQKIGIQIAHSGRKGSALAPWLSPAGVATPVAGGWPHAVKAPSALQYAPAYATPTALTVEEIQDLHKAYALAARRAIRAGFDVIEVHAAHGYLLHEFLSPESNHRTDAYGGSFENRTRLLLEVVDIVRAVIPASTPVFVRLSGTDWLDESEQSWRGVDTTRIAGILADHGVDLIDVSSAGLSPNQNIVRRGPAYQVPFSADVKAAHGQKILVSAVGALTTGTIAQEVLDKNEADVIFVGRHFQKNPGLVWSFAEDLGVSIRVARQIEWGFAGRGSIGKSKAAGVTALDL